MARIELNTVAPEFVLQDFHGQVVHLSDYCGAKHVILVFNRGFY